VSDPSLPVPAERATLLAVLGGVERRGAWEPPARLRVVAVMGGGRLDFREADLLEGVTEIEVLAFWGGVEIRVPRDVHVDAHGQGLLGGFTHLQHRAGEADVPSLRIRGIALMGGVEVKLG